MYRSGLLTCSGPLELSADNEATSTVHRRKETVEQVANPSAKVMDCSAVASPPSRRASPGFDGGIGNSANVACFGLRQKHLQIGHHVRHGLPRRGIAVKRVNCSAQLGTPGFTGVAGATVSKLDPAATRQVIPLGMVTVSVQVPVLSLA